jgi:hypothetical protein
MVLLDSSAGMLSVVWSPFLHMETSWLTTSVMLHTAVLHAGISAAVGLMSCCVAGVCLQVRVGGDVAHVLSLPRGQLDSFLGAVGVGLASKAAILQVLQQCKSLRVSVLGHQHVRMRVPCLYAHPHAASCVHVCVPSLLVKLV